MSSPKIIYLNKNEYLYSSSINNHNNDSCCLINNTNATLNNNNNNHGSNYVYSSYALNPALLTTDNYKNYAPIHDDYSDGYVTPNHSRKMLPSKNYILISNATTSSSSHECEKGIFQRLI